KKYQKEHKEHQKAPQKKVYPNPNANKYRLTLFDKFLLTALIALTILFGTLVATGKSFKGLISENSTNQVEQVAYVDNKEITIR
ncbi:TPA: teichoic acids export ATP-binding protein TagH, partial [Listeria innocua]|nr:teichoic acids export ATP-binding protein TagH [Listeria innocua]